MRQNLLSKRAGEERTVGDEGAEEEDQGAKDPACVGERERVRQQADTDQDVDPGG